MGLNFELTLFIENQESRTKITEGIMILETLLINCKVCYYNNKIYRTLS